MKDFTIWRSGNYRILECIDEYATWEDLAGDSYSLAVNPKIDFKQLAKEEKDFKELVEHEGVYGYILQKWNPQVGIGWEHVDSCWGFVGRYSETDSRFKHYIVGELKLEAA